MPGFPDDALQNIALAFAPLEEALRDPNGLSALLANFGWSFDPTVPGGSLAFQQGLGGVVSSVTAVANDVVGNNLGQLAQDLPNLVNELQQIVVHPGGVVLPFSLNEFWSGTNGGPGFLVDLLDYLVSKYLQKTAPLAYGCLRFIGVFTEIQEPAVPAVDGFPGRAQYLRRSLNPSQLVAAVTDPQNVLASVYSWGQPQGKVFRADQLLESLAAISGALNVATTLSPASAGLFGLYYDPLPTSPAKISQLTITPFSYMVSGQPVVGNFKLSLNMVPIPIAGSRTGDPVGISLFPLASGHVGAKTQLSQNVAVKRNGNFSSAPVAMEIRPASVAITQLASSSLSTLNAEARIDATAGSAKSWTLLGSSVGSSIGLAALHLAIDEEGSPTDPSIKIELGLDKLTLNVDFSDADSFLSMIFGSGKQAIQFPLTISWSNRTGFTFNGNDSLKALIPLQKSILNAIVLDALTLSLTAIDSVAVLGAAVSASAILGPIGVVVDQVGFSINIDTKPKPDAPNNSGLFAAHLHFKPPNGIGLAINAPSVVGGGYLFFDGDKQQYAGILQLEIAKTIAVKAIGLLTTRLPDGSKGFSLLVIITVEGFSPIQLGFGFTLTGIGGLLGVNRTAAVDALRSGIKARTLGSILFPVDPVRNAARIVSDVGTVFPPAVNRYVFGPMVMINWGTPPILTLEIGLVLEVPDPIRLLILGRLQAVLPDATNALVQIRMDALGVIDFGKGEVSLDATLYDSRLLSFVLTGDMAMRANFGQSPGFLLAVGGWNPRFPSPAGFPVLSRMSLTLSSSDNARLRLESYLAVTSNTVQFGARADFYFGAGPFGVEGYLGFDALFHFAPFSFIADLSASVALRSGSTILMSVGLNMTLSGPSPWHVWGVATFTILFFNQSVSFDAKYGVDQPPVLPDPVDVKALLTAALNDARNWSSELPAGERPLVAFRPSASTTDVLRVHPLAEIAVRERVTPLDTPINKFGNSPVSGDRQFSLKAVRSDNGAEIPSQDISDDFALAQFVDMSDDQKLSSPAFTQEHAGIRFTTGDFAYGYEPALDTTITYETLMISPGQPAQQLQSYSMPAAVLDSAATLGAAAQVAKQRISGASGRGIRM